MGKALAAFSYQRLLWSKLLGGLDRLLHDLCSSLDDCSNTHRLIVRQKVGDPDEPTTALTLGKDLHGGMVVDVALLPLDHRVCQSTCLIVMIDDQFAYYCASCVGK